MILPKNWALLILRNDGIYFGKRWNKLIVYWEKIELITAYWEKIELITNFGKRWNQLLGRYIL